MRQTLAIHAALKRLLKARGRTYAEAATALELSEACCRALKKGFRSPAEHRRRLGIAA